MSFSVGQMGMTIDGLNALTPAQFIYAQMGYIEKCRQQELAMYRVQRWHAATTLLPYSQHAIAPEKLLPLPSDAPTPNVAQRKKLTTKQRLKRAEKLLKGVIDG